MSVCFIRIAPFLIWGNAPIPDRLNSLRSRCVRHADPGAFPPSPLFSLPGGKFRANKNPALMDCIRTGAKLSWYHLNCHALHDHSCALIKRCRLTHVTRLTYCPERGSACCSGVLFAQALLRGSHCPALTGSESLWYFSPSLHLDTHIIAHRNVFVKRYFCLMIT